MSFAIFWSIISWLGFELKLRYQWFHLQLHSTLLSILQGCLTTNTFKGSNNSTIVSLEFQLAMSELHFFWLICQNWLHSLKLSKPIQPPHHGYTLIGWVGLPSGYSSGRGRGGAWVPLVPSFCFALCKVEYPNGTLKKKAFMLTFFEHCPSMFVWSIRAVFILEPLIVHHNTAFPSFFCCHHPASTVHSY